MSTPNRTGRELAIAVLFALSIPLAACSEDKQAETGETISNDTLATELARAGSLSSVSDALNQDGLAPVLDGTASYTLLAPTNEAFGPVAQLGLDETQSRAVLADVLRDHILPGAFDKQDIVNAIESSDGTVAMKTMGGAMVTFSRDGDSVRVTGEDGATAMLVGEPVLASNGAALPIDGILREF